MSNIFVPKTFVDSVFDINTEMLREKGIKAFVFDIDNTLATYAMPVPDEKTALWLKELQAQGFGVCFASNNSEKRVKAFAESVGIPYISRAMKPLKRHLMRACRNMGASPGETALVGDQLFTDVCGGNRMGMYTILVKPISEVEDGFVKFKRNFERKMMKKMKGDR